MFFISRYYKRKDVYDKILIFNENVYYVGEESLAKYLLDNYKLEHLKTRWLYTKIYDSTFSPNYLIILTFNTIRLIDKNLDDCREIKCEESFSNILCFDYLVVLFNSRGVIKIYHLFKEKGKVDLILPIDFEVNEPIFDIELIKNNLFVLLKDKIVVLEYTGQLLKLIDTIEQNNGIRLINNNDNLLVVCPFKVQMFSLNKFITLFNTNTELISCKKTGDNVFFLDKQGNVYDLNGTIKENIGQCSDFEWFKNVFLTISHSYSDKHNENQNYSLNDNYKFNSSAFIDNTFFFCNGSFVKRWDFKNKAIQFLKDKDIKTDYNYETKYHKITISDKLIECKSKSDAYSDVKLENVDYYKHCFFKNELVLFNKTSILIICNDFLEEFNSLSSRACFSTRWVILSNFNILKFFNLSKRKFEYLQVFDSEIIQLHAINDILFCTTTVRSYLILLMKTPTPPVEIEGRASFVQDKLLALEEQMKDYKFEYKSGIFVSSINNCSFFRDFLISRNDNSSIIYKLDNLNNLVPQLTVPFNLKCFYDIKIEDNTYTICFSGSTLHVYLSENHIYDYDIKGYLCCAVDKLIFIGYNNYIMAYKLGKKTLLKKYKISLDYKPIVLKFYKGILIVSVESFGLLLFKEGSLVCSDFYCRTVNNFIVEEDKIYCTDSNGCVFIYQIDLTTFKLLFISSQYIGDCISLYFNNQVLNFVTGRGEVGEIVEVDKETYKSLRKIECVLKKAGHEYFSSFTGINMFNLNYLKDILMNKLVNKPIEKEIENILIRKFKPIDLSILLKKCIFEF